MIKHLFQHDQGLAYILDGYTSSKMLRYRLFYLKIKMRNDDILMGGYSPCSINLI